MFSAQKHKFRINKTSLSKKLTLLFQSLIIMLLTVVMKVIPWSLAYKLSDLIAYMLIKARVRLNITTGNIKKCLPDMTQAEQQYVIKQSYHRLSDKFIEVLKVFSMSTRQKKQMLHEKVTFINPDILKVAVNEHQKVLVITSHYSNHEFTAYYLASLTTSFVAAGKPIKNLIMDYITNKNRKLFGIEVFHQNRFAKAFIRSPKAVGYLASDQKPSANLDTLRVNFLNIDTHFMTGPERIAQSCNACVLYAKLMRVKRGKYDLELVPLDAKSSEKWPITYQVAKLIEQQILTNPCDYLWSHDRWNEHK